jgi:ubiquinone biosynthesis protein Coq4
MLKHRALNIDFLQTIKGAISLLRDPGQTESVYDIEDGLSKTEATKQAIAYLKAKPGVAAIIEERYLAPAPDLEALLQLPSDSLGYVYAKYITDSGFDPNFYRKVDINDDISYVLFRLRQTHDLWHIVTGCNTDVVDELALKAFEIPQARRTMSVVLLAGGILRVMFNNPEDLDRLLDRIAVMYRMGAKAKPFLAQKWEDDWEKPLSRWREELGVELVDRYIPS